MGDFYEMFFEDAVTASRELEIVLTSRDRNGVPEVWPQNVFRGKVVVLCNEYSFSDAEIFPAAVKIRST